MNDLDITVLFPIKINVKKFIAADYLLLLKYWFIFVLCKKKKLF